VHPPDTHVTFRLSDPKSGFATSHLGSLHTHSLGAHSNHVTVVKSQVLTEWDYTCILTVCNLRLNHIRTYSKHNFLDQAIFCRVTTASSMDVSGTQQIALRLLQVGAYDSKWSSRLHEYFYA
jgi:hypothetical protein